MAPSSPESRADDETEGQADEEGLRSEGLGMLTALVPVVIATALGAVGLWLVIRGGSL